MKMLLSSNQKIDPIIALKR